MKVTLTRYTWRHFWPTLTPAQTLYLYESCRNKPKFEVCKTATSPFEVLIWVSPVHRSYSWYMQPFDMKLTYTHTHTHTPLVGIVQRQQLKHRVHAQSFIGTASAAVAPDRQMSPRRWWRQPPCPRRPPTLTAPISIRYSTFTKSKVIVIHITNADVGL